MSSIADIINKNLSKRQAVVQGDDQSAVQQQLAAKAGRAGVAGPKASSVGQQAAQADVAAQQRQLDVQGSLLGQQLVGQQQALDAKTAQATEELAAQRRMTEKELGARAATGAANRAAAGEIQAAQLGTQESMTREKLSNALDQTAKELASQRGLTLNEIFREFRQSNADLAQRRDAAQLEQLGFVMALRDKEYIRDIEQIGQLRRLDNKLNWEKEVQDITFGADIDALLDQFDWQSAYNKEEREWGVKMAQMSADQALKLAKAAAKQAAKKALFKLGASTASSYAQYKMQPQTTNTAGGSTSQGTDGTYTTQPSGGQQGYN